VNITKILFCPCPHAFGFTSLSAWPFLVLGNKIFYSHGVFGWDNTYIKYFNSVFLKIQDCAYVHEGFPNKGLALGNLNFFTKLF